MESMEYSWSLKTEFRKISQWVAEFVSMQYNLEDEDGCHEFQDINRI